jgi:mannose-6-phosphate isomerase-like protein (cupin superfamily)
MSSKNAINLKEKFSLFNELWTPKIIAQMNDYHFKIAHIQGEFTWHEHSETDEVFFVIEGSMKIDFRGDSVDLKSGELYVVPKGVEHKPYAENPCKILIVEPADTVNTGESGGDLTAPGDVWI